MVPNFQLKFYLFSRLKWWNKTKISHIFWLRAPRRVSRSFSDVPFLNFFPGEIWFLKLGTFWYWNFIVGILNVFWIKVKFKSLQRNFTKYHFSKYQNFCDMLLIFLNEKYRNFRLFYCDIWTLAQITLKGDL